MRFRKFFVTLTLLLALIITGTGCSPARPGDETGSSGDVSGSSAETDVALPDGFSYADSNYVINGTAATASVSAADILSTVYGGAFRNEPMCENGFSVEVTVTPRSKATNAGLLFGAFETEGNEGFNGYAFTLFNNKVFLYQVRSLATKMTVTELANLPSGDFKRSTGRKLRVEAAGGIVRCYLCEDPHGTEPWPEFEFELDLRGTGIGYFDNGQGAEFEGFRAEPLSETDPGNTYQNPIFGPYNGADPYVLYHDGVYYLYCSGYSPFNEGFWYWTSTDLVNWVVGEKCAGPWFGAGSGTYWAPEVYKIGDRFVMVATVNQRTVIAESDSPGGPFVPQDDYLIDGRAIDGHIFVDDDGRLYLYYVNAGIHGCELNENLAIVPGTERTVFKANETWEGGVTEAPFVVKHNGVYYLMFSGNNALSAGYAVGYATSNSPLGTYEKYDANPILLKTFKTNAPGHNSIISSPDGSELFIVYHTHRSTGSSTPRTINIDRVRFVPTESGIDRIEVYGPTTVPQPVPKK